MHKFAGIYTPLATPFAADGRLDTRALARNVEKYLQSPLTGLVVLGSNGEAAQLDEAEAEMAIKTVRARDAEGSAAARRHRPRIDRGDNCMRPTRRRSRRRCRARAHAIVLQGADDDRCVRASLHAVANRSPVPVLLYNVTMYTGVNLLPEAVGILSRHPNIVGIKETNSDMVQFGEYLARAEEGFTVLAGSGATYYSALALGAHGAILAVAGVAPKLCVDIFNAVREGRFDDAKAMHRRLAPLSKLVGPQYGVPD